MTTALITKTTDILAVGDEVIHDSKEWTVESVALLEQAPDALYDLKLHRVPGRQDDALSEDWQDVTASDKEQWQIVLAGPAAVGTLTVAVLFANKDKLTDIYGDIYTEEAECRRQHPADAVLLGYGVLDLSTGLLADRSADFHTTPEEARAFIAQQK